VDKGAGRLGAAWDHKRHTQLTTETIITDLPEKEKAPAMPPGGGMGGMDY
jgi:hypothetical protein